MDIDAKEQLIRAYAQAIMPITDYIPGPDMGTNEAAMAWVKDEGGQCAGLPKAVGGIPLDEIGATAYGVVASADVAKDHLNMSLDGARIAVQGFGAVGKHAARFFAAQGSVLVAAADYSGTVLRCRRPRYRSVDQRTKKVAAVSLTSSMASNCHPKLLLASIATSWFRPHVLTSFAPTIRRRSRLN